MSVEDKRKSIRIKNSKRGGRERWGRGGAQNETKRYEARD